MQRFVRITLQDDLNLLQEVSGNLFHRPCITMTRKSVVKKNMCFNLFSNLSLVRAELSLTTAVILIKIQSTILTDIISYCYQVFRTL